MDNSSQLSQAYIFNALAFSCVFVCYHICVYEQKLDQKTNNALGILFMVYLCPSSIQGYILALRASKHCCRLEGHKYTINKMPKALFLTQPPLIDTHIIAQNIQIKSSPSILTIYAQQYSQYHYLYQGGGLDYMLNHITIVSHGT